MKAISVKQPWANLIAFLFKWFETRTWGTKYRGRILIVSSLKPDKHALGFVDAKKPPWTEYPYGYAIAVAELTESRPMTVDDQEGSCCTIYPKAHVFRLENVRRIKPIKVKGQLGIYNTDIQEEDLEYLT